jgi:hypothetical protein
MVWVITRGERRRAWSTNQKRLVVSEAMQPGAMPVEVLGYRGAVHRALYLDAGWCWRPLYVWSGHESALCDRLARTDGQLGRRAA